MFKKIVLATAVATISVGASAASWDTALSTAVKHTIEGISQDTVADGVVTGNAQISLGAEFAVNDEITFTYNVAKATNYNWPQQLYSNNVGTAGVTLGAKGVANASQDTIFLQTVSDNNTAGQTGVVVGDKFTIPSSGTQVYTVDALTTGAGSAGIDVIPDFTDATIDNEVVTFINQTKAFVTLGLMNSNTTSVTYRVLTKEAGRSTIGSLIAVPNPQVNIAAASAAGSVTVAYTARTSSGAAVDTFATTSTVATFVDQQVLTLTKKFDGVVDVEADKKALNGFQPNLSNVDTATVNSAGASMDGVTITGTMLSKADGQKIATSTTGTLTVAAVTGIQATMGSAVHKINGDFTWMDNATTAGVQVGADAVQGTDSDAVNATGTIVTATDTTLAGNESIILKALVATAVLPVQSYDGSSVVTYTPATSPAATKTYTWADMGKWTLNGATVTVYGVPMGSSVNRFLWVNNAGTTSAPMTYTAVMNGSSYGPYSIGSVAGKTAASVGGLIDNDLADRGVFIAPSSRANITLDTQVKAADITVSAAYKHIGDADRLSLETSDTLDGTSK